MHIDYSFENQTMRVLDLLRLNSSTIEFYQTLLLHFIGYPLIFEIGSPRLPGYKGKNQLENLEIIKLNKKNCYFREIDSVLEEKDRRRRRHLRYGSSVM